MKLPPAYESGAAYLRIKMGLEQAGVTPNRASWAARGALDEAPFAEPTEEGWRWVCNRARELADKGRQ